MRKLSRNLVFLALLGAPTIALGCKCPPESLELSQLRENDPKGYVEHIFKAADLVVSATAVRAESLKNQYGYTGEVVVSLDIHEWFKGPKDIRTLHTQATSSMCGGPVQLSMSRLWFVRIYDGRARLTMCDRYPGFVSRSLNLYETLRSFRESASNP